MNAALSYVTYVAPCAYHEWSGVNFEMASCQRRVMECVQE